MADSQITWAGSKRSGSWALSLRNLILRSGGRVFRVFAPLSGNAAAQ